MEEQNKRPESYHFSMKMFVFGVYALIILGFVYLIKLGFGL